MSLNELWNWLRGKKRGVLDYSNEELTREERILAREKKALINKMARIAREKQDIITRGFSRKSPELRVALAQDFEQKEIEERLTARSLNIKGKELLTVSRIKIARESQGENRTSRLLTGLSERDMLELQRMITADDVSREMYEDKLNEILSISMGEARPESQLTESGRRLLEMWQEMDDGELTGERPSVEKAERHLDGGADELSPTGARTHRSPARVTTSSSTEPPH